MKSGWRLVSGTLVTVLLVAIFGAVSAWATDRYVATTGTDTGNCSNPGNPCKTIQYAIGQASAGDTIHVAAGTYQESLGGWRDIEIFKSVNIIGAGSGQTIVELSNKQNGVEIRPDAIGVVLIQGITFTRMTGNQSSAGFAIRVGETGGTFNSLTFRDVEVAWASARNIFIDSPVGGTTYQNILIEDCNIHDAGAWGLSARGTIVNMTVTNSHFDNNGWNDAAHGIGFDLDMPTSVGTLTVTGGTFNGNTSKGINLVNTKNATFTDITASGNGGDGVTIWEWLGTSQNLVFNNPTLNNNALDGFLIGAEGGKTVNGVTINGGTLSGNGRGGLLIYNYPDSPGTIQNIAVHCANISDNVQWGIFTNTTPAVDAENNWWGHASGPSGQGPGTGDPVSTDVDFDPWVRVQVPEGASCAPGADTDQDGLPDTLEMGGDNDQDPTTTTDPLDPDTDNDGLLDGEDENHNGQVDQGETDPNDWDTDGDNLCDGSASLPTGTACTTVSKSGRNGEDLDGDENPADRGVTETDPTKADTDGDGIDDFNDDIPLKPGGGGCFGVAAYSTPTRVTYRPTARMASTRAIVVTIINNSGGPITVPASAFTPQPDEVFTIVRVSPTLPRTIRNGRRASFSVLTRVAAGQPAVTAVAPYFNINLDCGVVSSAGVMLTPLELEGVQAEMYNNQLLVEAYGLGIASIQVQLFDLAGRAVMDQKSKGNVLVIALPTGATGKPLAKGVYLYVVTVKGYDGSIQRSEVRKLVLR